MLAKPNRLTTSAEFALATRRGRRCARPALVTHLWVPEMQPEGADNDTTAQAQPPKAGFVVSRSVGNAVVRNTVVRRLREAVRARLDRLPAGSLLVVRALPAAAAAPLPTLAVQLDDCLERLLPATTGTAVP